LRSFEKDVITDQRMTDSLREGFMRIAFLLHNPYKAAGRIEIARQVLPCQPQ
jgi:hypothetical protein